MIRRRISRTSSGATHGKCDRDGIGRRITIQQHVHQHHLALTGALRGRQFDQRDYIHNLLSRADIASRIGGPMDEHIPAGR